ncbi:MAG TPA: hypothetical protein ENJ00_09755 [Phycisphaerales bacterium]|nr:hypothetical protein [Phycisphaerales bacterium]
MAIAGNATDLESQRMTTVSTAEFQDDVTDLAARLREITNGLNYPQIASKHGISSETARRYLRDGKPSVQFVISLARSSGVSLDWLLLGRGPRFNSEVDHLRHKQDNASKIAQRALTQIHEMRAYVKRTDAMLDSVVDSISDIDT